MAELTPCPPNCRYAGRIGADDCCDYWLITDRLRGCEGGAGCLRYETADGAEQRYACVHSRADDAIALAAEGLSDREIAEKIGVSKYSVARWRKLNNVAAVKKRSVKFDAKEARQLYDAGMIDREIGARLGIAAQTVNKWRHREGLPSNAGRRELYD